MSIELVINPAGLFKKSISVDDIIGELCYGVDDGLRLNTDDKSGKDFVVYDPKCIGRGFTLVCERSERKQIFMRLPTPCSDEEVDCFYDMVERICAIWKNHKILQDGTTTTIEEINANRDDMKIFNLHTLRELCSTAEYPELCLFCALWPLHLGTDEMKRFANAADMTDFSRYMHKMQEIDVYYARPSFYSGSNGYFGVYVLTEGVRSIFPTKARIPFGMQVNDGKALPDGRWYLGMYSTKEKKVIGTILYKDFIANIGNANYYDAQNVIVEAVPLETMLELHERYGVELDPPNMPG